VALPSSSTQSLRDEERNRAVGRLVIGMDPTGDQATIEVLDERERVLGTGRFGHRP
jgi:hypothetical protein